MPRYDINIASPNGKGPAWVKTSDGVLSGVAGPKCLSNLILRLLLTTKGTNPTARNEGTLLGSLAGSTVDVGQVQAAVLAAIMEVETYVKKLQLRSPAPRNETLAKLVPKKVTLNGDNSLDIHILIHTLDSTVTPLGFSI